MAQQPLAPDDAKIHPETHPLFQRLYGEEGFAPLSVTFQKCFGNIVPE